MKRIILSAFAFVLSGMAVAQNCGTTLTAEDERLEKLFQESIKHSIPQKSSEETHYIIPVVFHIIDDGGSVSNVNYERIEKTMDRLNRSYSKSNNEGTKHIDLVSDRFKGIAADMNIEFRLALKKPDGSSFSGITRTAYTGYLPWNAGAGSENNYHVKAVQNEHGFFSESKYLNVYITKNAPERQSAYAYLPGTGVNSMYRGVYTGESWIDGNQNSYTFIHEVGHWLNLRHTFQGGCSSTYGDRVDDTPATIQYNNDKCYEFTNCKNEYVNYENFMDYHGSCYRMFTEGQKSRVRSAISYDNYTLKNVVSQANLLATGVIDEVGVLNSHDVVCKESEVQFNDVSNLDNKNQWKWTFEGAEISESTEQHPKVTFVDAGTFDVTLEVSNGNKTITRVFENLITVNQSYDSLKLDFNDENYSEEKLFTTDKREESNDFGTGQLTDQGLLYVYNNSSYTDSEVEIITAPVLFEGAIKPVVNFKWAYRAKSSVIDKLEIYFTGNCGNNWTKFSTVEGSNLVTKSGRADSFIPSVEDDWRNISLDSKYITSGLRTNMFQLKFKFISKGGAIIFFDDIEIKDLEAKGANVAGGELNVVDFKAYPNPVDGELNINYSLEKSSEVYIEISNLLGQTVYSNEISQLPGLQNNTVQTNSYPKGVYIVKLVVDGKAYFQKVNKR